MIEAGANVVIAVDGGWDTHNDRTGASVRGKMNNNILPGLRTLMTRMMADPTKNVTAVIFGDFARSLPNSDHANGTSATVIDRAALAAARLPYEQLDQLTMDVLLGVR
jgi:hypothetical protein